MANRIYIRSAAQISVQKPLCEDWMTDPVRLSGEYLRSQDPDFKQFLNPMQARRMGLILKRAIAVSLTALKDAGIECPDAIFTGTGLGCMENTENFLSAMCRDGEEMLPPTYFMMSTHNTISSAVAILLRCHGYNCTYSQKDISFESALLDAFIQLQAGRMGNALVGSHDETTPDTYRLLRGAGYFDDTVTAAEASSAFVLSADSGSLSLSKGPLCELADVQILHSPANLESIVKEYNASRILRSSDYFTLFGKCFSASGLGVYEAAAEKWIEPLSSRRSTRAFIPVVFTWKFRKTACKYRRPLIMA